VRVWFRSLQVSTVTPIANFFTKLRLAIASHSPSTTVQLTPGARIPVRGVTDRHSSANC